MASTSPVKADGALKPGRGKLLILWRRLAKRPTVVVSVLFLLLVGVAIINPSLFTSADPYSLNPVDRLQPPSASNWFGTDENGRDIFGRIAYGARITVGLTLFAIGLSLSIGLLVGSLAGLAGGRVDRLLMGVTDIFLAFPQLILAMAIVAALGPGMLHAMIGISFAWWSQYARIVRSQIMVVREREYVAAAISLGQHPLIIVLRHMLPNAMTPVLVKASLDLGLIMLNLAGLSFIGLGATPPTPEWGAMIAGGRNLLLDHPWVPTFPGLAIFTTVMACNFVADWIRDITDPRNS